MDWLGLFAVLFTFSKPIVKGVEAFKTQKRSQDVYEKEIKKLGMDKDMLESFLDGSKEEIKEFLESLEPEQRMIVAGYIGSLSSARSSQKSFEQELNDLEKKLEKYK